MNKVTLIGRLTKDPELKFTQGKGAAVCTFTLAVDRRMSKDGQKEADFIPIVIWNKPAEVIANYMTKGKLIAIAGRIQTRSYDANDGAKRYVTEVVAEDFQFIDKGNGQESNNQADNHYKGVTPLDDDQGDIPF